MAAAPTLAGFAVPSLSTIPTSPHILATDFLAGATLLQLRETAASTAAAAAAARAKAPTAASAEPALELSAVCAMRQPVYAQAALGLGPDMGRMVVAAHPHGLMVGVRDVEEEAAAAEAAQRAADALASRGEGGRVGWAGGGWGEWVG